MRVLVVEDDPRLLANIATILTRAYYAVDTAATGREGMDKVLTEDYDCVVLDWMLPDGDGVNYLRKLRKQQIKTPVIMLTARSLSPDVIMGLDAGADDYITKPFDAEVLLARIRAAIRRTLTPAPTSLRAGLIVVETASHQVRVDSTPLLLTPKEYALLEYLMVYKNTMVPRIDLISHVWDENANLFSNSVDVYINHLRKKLSPYKQDSRIKTVKGMGYMICDD